MSKLYFFGAFILLLIVVPVYLLLQSGKQSATSSKPTPKIPEDKQVEKVVNQSVRTFEIEGMPFEFNPKEIRVKKGETVKIVFKNTEGLHDLAIDEFNARTKQILVNQSDTVEFTASQAGTYEYYCSVGDHRQKGMMGKLIVE